MFVGAAVVLLVFSLLAVLAELQVPESMLWTGQQVTGTEQQGLVYYRWQGQSYSLDVPGFGSSKAVSVYFNPGDPSQAIVDHVTGRVLTGLFVRASGGRRGIARHRRYAKLPMATPETQTGPRVQALSFPCAADREHRGRRPTRLRATCCESADRLAYWCGPACARRPRTATTPSFAASGMTAPVRDRCLSPCLWPRHFGLGRLADSG